MNSTGRRVLAAIAKSGLVLFFACASAQMVETKGASPYAPKNERRGGRVRYLAQGAESIVTERREDAYKQMHAKCSGHYEIVREWDSVNDKVTAVYGSTTSNASAHGSATPYQWNASAYGTSTSSGYAMTSDVIYRNIDFACTAPPALADKRGLGVVTPARGQLSDNSVERSQGQAPTQVAGVEDQLVGFLSLESGCDRSRITLTGSQRPAHRLVACGRSYVCIEGAPAPTCRLALSEQVDGGLSQ